MDNLKEFNLSELSEKNGIASAQIWVGYKGLIYDVTSSELFAGGKHYSHVAGTDLTEFMPDAPHTEQVMKKFPIVGKLAGGSAPVPVVSPVATPATSVVTSAPVTSVYSKPVSSFYAGNQAVGALVKEFDAVVTGIKDIGRAMRLITLSIADSSFTYAPGQYINIQAEIGGERCIKSYSIIGKSAHKNQISILVAHRTLGKMTTFLFEKIALNATLKIKAPYGKFLVPQFITKDLIFIANDVSIASVYTHIYALLKDKRITKNISLIYGNHFYGDFVFHEEFIEMAKQHSNFTYLPVADREGNRAWNYSKGTLKSAIESAINPNAEYYITGWKDVVDTAINILKLRSIPAIYIKTELFN